MLPCDSETAVLASAENISTNFGSAVSSEVTPSSRATAMTLSRPTASDRRTATVLIDWAKASRSETLPR